jgi:hypothetical protein
MRKMSVLQPLLEQFPTKTIREYFIPNRELPIDNSPDLSARRARRHSSMFVSTRTSRWTQSAPKSLAQ